VFRAGNPPAVKARKDSENAALSQKKRDSVPQLAGREATPTILAYVTAYATSIISSACDCLANQLLQARSAQRGLRLPPPPSLRQQRWVHNDCMLSQDMCLYIP